jgi:hypothetical protein
VNRYALNDPHLVMNFKKVPDSKDFKRDAGNVFGMHCSKSMAASIVKKINICVALLDKGMDGRVKLLNNISLTEAQE